MTTIFENSETDAEAKAPEVAPDVDGVVTLAMIELLLNPEYGDMWLQELSEELGLELTEAQLQYLGDTVARTMDQLAIPFVETLSASFGEVFTGKDFYREMLDRRAAQFNSQSAPDVKVYTLDDVTDAGVVYDLLGE